MGKTVCKFLHWVKTQKSWEGKELCNSRAVNHLFADEEIINQEHVWRDSLRESDLFLNSDNSAANYSMR